VIDRLVVEVCPLFAGLDNAGGLRLAALRSPESVYAKQLD